MRSLEQRMSTPATTTLTPAAIRSQKRPHRKINKVDKLKKILADEVELADTHNECGDCPFQRGHPVSATSVSSKTSSAATFKPAGKSLSALMGCRGRRLLQFRVFLLACFRIQRAWPTDPTSEDLLREAYAHAISSAGQGCSSRASPTNRSHVSITCGSAGSIMRITNEADENGV